MEIRKSLAIILGVTIMSTITTGCATTAKTPKAAAENEKKSAAKNSDASSSNTTADNKEEVSAFTYTEMQKLMADKAVKFSNEHNPIIAYKFSADPAVLVYNDTVYVYATNDMQQVETTKGKQDNGYGSIRTLNVFSSKDLVNWTNCGEIKAAGRTAAGSAAKWANNSWAPAIATKKIDGKDKFFLYFADNGSGIGVLTADSPTGPFVDPIGKQLISRSTPNTEGVYWLFDPAVFVDDDGTGYLYYGGGVKDDSEHPKSGRCVQLGEDMISIVGTPVEIDAPFLFEDSGINKINGKYVYSYCANWADRKQFPDAKEKPDAATIAYMTSDSPLGPFQYQGFTLKNPGAYFGAWGNNHHWIFQFKNKWYIAYHAQTMEKRVGLEKGGYRNIFMNEFAVNEDGSLPVQTVKMEGVEQICNFNPYEETNASTMKNSIHIIIKEDADSKQQIAIPDAKNAYICISKADFSEGASSIKVKTAQGSKNGTLKVCFDHQTKGPVIAEIQINGSVETEAALTLPDFANDEEKIRDLFFVFDGDFALESFRFIK